MPSSPTARAERPRGRYLAEEAGYLAGVPGTTIGQWARRGYIASSQSSGRPRVYCYQDVAEAMLVHELTVLSVRPRSIRAVVARLGEELGTPWPLQNSHLLVPAEPAPGRRSRSVVVEADGTQTDVVMGHLVLAGLDLVGVISDLSRGGWAARTIPITHIEVDPDRLSGRPVIRGRGVPARLVDKLA
jgi:DNA-binding transcriptional MerR regulator